MEEEVKEVVVDLVWVVVGWVRVVKDMAEEMGLVMVAWVKAVMGEVKVAKEMAVWVMVVSAMVVVDWAMVVVGWVIMVMEKAEVMGWEMVMVDWVRVRMGWVMAEEKGKEFVVIQYLQTKGFYWKFGRWIGLYR